MVQSRSRHLVDPELAPLLELFPPIVLSDETLHQLRDLQLAEAPISETGARVEVRRFSLPGPPGAPEVPAILYLPPQAARPMPCIFHIHGGGFVAGKAERQEPMHRDLAHDLSCAILSVDYRLAPETPFPGAIEDCYAALAWLFAKAGEFGIDATRIGVMGESAGGGLAAALALLARDRGEHRLAFQHLIYPMLDDRTCVAAHPHPLTGEFIWTAHNNHYGWRSLLGAEPGGAEVSAYAAPARAADVSGLPPTFLSTAALDLFLEENLDYARRLMRAGVPVELHVWSGAFHAFDLVPAAEVARRARRESKAGLEKALGGAQAP
ncbi:MAG TPA: alpha/beta hydrolase [Caulobacteraceae bacterium]|nr:alpha/beta hydrolase [Caulobacteraceae bacterium]